MGNRTAPPDLPTREVRRLTASGMEFREADDGLLAFSGYASTFGEEYEMYGGPDRGGWVESVDPGAFTKTLSAKPDVMLLVNHDGLPLARTKSGTLTLEADKKGLRAEASLDPADPDVEQLRVKVERGDLDEMSFAFRTIRQEWDEDYERRTLLELALDRGDVSIVTYGANPTTSFDLRTLLEADPDRVLAELRSIGDPAFVARVQAALIDPESEEDTDEEDEPEGTPLGLARALVEALDLPAA